LDAAAAVAERKQKILETFETDQVRQEAAEVIGTVGEVDAAGRARDQYQKAARDEQLRELERLWYKAGGERSRFAAHLMKVIERLSEKYQVDELAAKYAFTGRTALTVEQALAVREELETIDKLLKQLEEAAKTAQIAIIDVDELSQFVDPEQMESLNALQKQVEEMVRRLPKSRMEKTKKGYQPRRRPIASFGSCWSRSSASCRLRDRATCRTDRRRKGRRVAVGSRMNSAIPWRTWISSARSPTR
jgi:hypothetical protein